ncbi:MAG TPA: ABC transporter ATP-binding protein [Dehalococcoidia bacterium]|nr:ABC transporter ATP-binding protein [Dehalococcoidia bacterium]
MTSGLVDGAIGAAPWQNYYIFCEDLFKIYKIADLEVVALRGLDLRVEPGELMAIVGASGSGKSTLLNILAGLDVPSAGRCYIGGRDLLAMSDAELIDYRRSQVGFVWQQTGRNLIPYLNARENVAVPLTLSGVGRAKARARATELLDAVGLAPRMHHRPEQLSGGEQQRVAIAVALANEPPLLLADEPTGELDSIGADDVFRVLADLNERMKVTIVIVTHDDAIAERVNRVVTIRDGRTAVESFRRIELHAGRIESRHDDFAVVDNTGRLQIPRAMLEQLAIHDRARLDFAGDRVEVRPEPKLEERGMAHDVPGFPPEERRA